jgi:flagellar protein FlbD
MIEVTRLNGTPMIVNSDLIKIAESSPDTMLTLIHGEKLIVRESCAEILEKMLAYRARLLAAVAASAGPAADLHRVVAMTSLSSLSSLSSLPNLASLAPGDAREPAAIPTGEVGKAVPALKFEPGGRPSAIQPRIPMG